MQGFCRTRFLVGSSTPARSLVALFIVAGKHEPGGTSNALPRCYQGASTQIGTRSESPYTEVMQLRTLAGLKLEGAAFSRPKPPLLLAYLALEGPQERRHLSELFWPGPNNALRNLSTTAIRLKAAAPGIVEGDGVRVWTSVDCDASALLTTLEDQELRNGIETYEGPFLDGLASKGLSSELEEWVYQTREFIASRVREALLNLAEVEASQGRFRQASKQAERAYLLAGAPALEPQEYKRLHVLMVAGGSLRAEEVRKEALDFDLTLVVSAAGAKDQLRLLDRGDHRSSLRNLPFRRTSFVGRELELSEVAELMAHNECRLLSVVGPGGVGKTRLALKAAEEQLWAGAFLDGVVFVPVEALTDASSIPAVVAGALGLSLSGEEDARSVVLRFLAEKHLLLVLDNFEHVLEGTSFIQELSLNSPRLKLLATSRERLNVEGEWVFEVEGLAFPEESMTLERARYFDAVQLFVERAKRAQPGFSLTPETLPVVMRISQLVDGMLLALELAASWLRALPVGDIVKELESSIDLLESPARDVPERHRSVRAVFDHSWSLLSEREKEALRRLSVFRGGFRREAAAVVAGATLLVLARLVDKSFLSMSPEGRYDRHPLLSQYTLEKLADLPQEREEVEQKHGSYYLRFVRELQPDLWTLARKEAFRVFLEELANIRAAWDWATLNLKVDEIERTTPVMCDFFGFRLTEGLEYFGTSYAFFGSIAEHLDESNPNHVGALGTVLIHQVLNNLLMPQVTDFQRVQEQAERGIKLLESQGESRGLARGFLALGYSFYHRYQFSQAKECAQQALALARKHGSARDIKLLCWDC